MELSNKYMFYIGTARGLLIYTNLKSDQKTQHVVPREPSETTSLEWGRTNDELIIGYKNGTVSLYNTLQNKHIKELTKLEGNGSVVGIGCVNDNVIVARKDGMVNTWSNEKQSYFSTNLDEKSTLECMVNNKCCPNIIATGGILNDLRLWDIETKQCTFKAKSLGHDELNLPIHTTITGICFLSEHEQLCCCATKEGYVLLYDGRVQRKPVVTFLEKKASYTTASCAFRERQCLAGTTKGFIQLIDMKMKKSLRTYTSMAGSVTSIVCDSSEPYVASTSLDRHFRIHNLETKELVYKEYMKQNLIKVVMKPIVKEESKEESKSVENIDDEYENIFNNLETVSDDDLEQQPKRKSCQQTDKKVKKAKRKKKVSE